MFIRGVAGIAVPVTPESALERSGCAPPGFGRSASGEGSRCACPLLAAITPGLVFAHDLTRRTRKEMIR